jgi:lanthanide-dependent methanol dehydrogenase
VGISTAYNIKDGSMAWRGYSMGPDRNADGPRKDHSPRQARRRIPALKTWQGDQWKIGGGTTWGWFSYDKELNLIYYGSGNPGTWNPVATPGRQQAGR